MLPDAPPYMKWDEEVARQLTDHNNRLQHLERLETPIAGGYTEGARAYNDVALNIPNGVWSTLVFNSERWDTDNIHSLVAFTERLTCRTAGRYVVSAAMSFAPNAVGIRYILLQASTGFNYAAELRDAVVFAGRPTRYTITTIVDLLVNQFMICNAWQNSGGVLQMEFTAGFSPEFMMHRIG